MCDFPSHVKDLIFQVAIQSAATAASNSRLTPEESADSVVRAAMKTARTLGFAPLKARGSSPA